MILRTFSHRSRFSYVKLSRMSTSFSTAANNGQASSATGTVSLSDLRKSNTFTSNLPPDPEFKKPIDSHKAPRGDLGPRMVKGALFTYVRPEETKDPELLAVSKKALKDIGLAEGEQASQEFRNVVAGNRIFWNEETREGIYPWAQCYGGWQFGSWAGQLGDGRAISLFESTNPSTKIRYEIQLKGAGKTPYSRFADGKAVLRSSIREFVVSEALNGLHIPTTRALALTLCPKSQVLRENFEPGAIVARFAESWLRIGTYDILRARGDRKLIRKLSDYVAEHVYPGWESLPGTNDSTESPAQTQARTIPRDTIEGPEGLEENRYTRLYRAIVRRNALTVAQWQAYAFTNGVLNTDNTSLLGLSLDFGPFAFLDNFDPSYTPNHDDHMLRYSYKNQPSVIWWNLVRLGESLGELIGSGQKVDDPEFSEKGVSEEFAPELIKRAETLIGNIGEEYKAVFLAEYKRLMRLRFGLKIEKDTDFDELFSELLDVLEALELDFNHFFRRLSSIKVSDLTTTKKRKEIAPRFFHAEGISATSILSEEQGKDRLAAWLEKWSQRIEEDWGADNDAEREAAMKAVNPKFIARSWILDELIRRVDKGGERAVLERVMRMVENPFLEHWAEEGEGEERAEEERWCGDVPRESRAMQCSCSS